MGCSASTDDKSGTPPEHGQSRADANNNSRGALTMLASGHVRPSPNATRHTDATGRHRSSGSRSAAHRGGGLSQSASYAVNASDPNSVAEEAGVGPSAASITPSPPPRALADGEERERGSGTRNPKHSRSMRDANRSRSASRRARSLAKHAENPLSPRLHNNEPVLNGMPPAPVLSHADRRESANPLTGDLVLERAHPRGEGPLSAHARTSRNRPPRTTASTTSRANRTQSSSQRGRRMMTSGEAFDARVDDMMSNTNRKPKGLSTSDADGGNGKTQDRPNPFRALAGPSATPSSKPTLMREGFGSTASRFDSTAREEPELPPYADFVVPDGFQRARVLVVRDRGGHSVASHLRTAIQVHRVAAWLDDSRRHQRGPDALSPGRTGERGLPTLSVVSTSFSRPQLTHLIGSSMAGVEGSPSLSFDARGAAASMGPGSPAPTPARGASPGAGSGNETPQPTLGVSGAPGEVRGCVEDGKFRLSGSNRRFSLHVAPNALPAYVPYRGTSRRQRPRGNDGSTSACAPSAPPPPVALLDGARVTPAPPAFGALIAGGNEVGMLAGRAAFPQFDPEFAVLEGESVPAGPHAPSEDDGPPCFALDQSPVSLLCSVADPVDPSPRAAAPELALTVEPVAPVPTRPDPADLSRRSGSCAFEHSGLSGANASMPGGGGQATAPPSPATAAMPACVRGAS